MLRCLGRSNHLDPLNVREGLFDGPRVISGFVIFSQHNTIRNLSSARCGSCNRKFPKANKTCCGGKSNRSSAIQVTVSVTIAVSTMMPSVFIRGTLETNRFIAKLKLHPVETFVPSELRLHLYGFCIPINFLWPSNLSDFH